MKTIISLLIALVIASSGQLVVCGHYSADLGEAQVINNHRTELCTVHTDSGFVVKKKLQENKDYIIVWNNKGTKKTSDDKLIMYKTR